MSRGGKQGPFDLKESCQRRLYKRSFKLLSKITLLTLEEGPNKQVRRSRRSLDESWPAGTRENFEKTEKTIPNADKIQ